MGLKPCCACGEAKLPEAFERDHRNKDGRAGRCKACRAPYLAAYYLKNKAKMRAYDAQHYAANTEARKVAAARWRKDNAEKWREYGRNFRKANPEKASASAARYIKSHPEKNRQHLRRRRALRLGAPGRGVTADQWNQVLADSLGLCAYCNGRRKLTLDHIDPLTRGGAHDIDNISAACQSCNSKKKDTPLLIWLARSAA